MNCIPRIAALLAMAFASVVAAAPANADMLVVTNCNDDGTGSLRHAVAQAASGSTIDASKLTCTTIPLSAQISVPQTDLTIRGPGDRRLTIDGNFAGRVFDHSGAGTLRLEHLWLVRGLDYVQYASGGCIRSNGNVHLRYVHMHACNAEGRRPPDYDGVGAGASAAGGGIDARGDVVLVFSQIHRSNASTYTGAGGAVAAGRTVRLYASRIYGNNASNGGGIAARELHATYSLVDHNTATEFGGVHASGDVFLLRSTIADNDAFYNCGGLCVEGTATIVDSTLSRNGSPTASAAAIMSDAAIHNSTIAANIEGSEPGTGCGVALSVGGALQLHSSIVASNYCRDGTSMRDIAAASITGTRNIVRTANVHLPADTIRANPRLHTLASNGGPTPTMALLDGSPAIDRGNNALGLSYDQRGPGHPRTRGVRTDIGAFER